MIKCKILMCGNVVVDVGMLDIGIYATSKPAVYFDPEKTIESMMAKESIYGRSRLPESYFDNLKKCRLVDAELQFNPNKTE